MSALSVLIPAPVADAAHDAAHETAARFLQGAYSVPCPKCHVLAGSLCLARRAVHADRRDLYRKNPQTHGLVPLLIGRSR